MADLWFRVVQWLTTLNSKKISIFLLSGIVTILLYDQYKLRESNDKLKEENERLYNRLSSRDNRNDSIISVVEKRLQDCADKRTEDMAKANEYWQKRVEILEGRLHSEYKSIKQVKQKLK